MQRNALFFLFMVIAMTTLHAGLVATDDGWRTEGLGYDAVVTRETGLTSLVVDDFEFVGTGGLYTAERAQRIPFDTITADGNQVVLQNAQATVTLLFQEDALVITLDNRTLVDGHGLRLAIHPAIARVKSQTGGDHDAPFTRSINTPTRLIAPGGQTLTLADPASYNLMAGGRLQPATAAHTLFMPYTVRGTKSTTTIGIRRSLPIEDALRVTTHCDKTDFTFWENKPVRLTTQVTNMKPGAPFKGRLELRLIDIVTKKNVLDMSCPLALAAGESDQRKWDLADVPPMLYIAEFHAIETDTPQREGLVAAPRFVYHAAAIAPPQPPPDFDAFWKRTLAEQAAIPLDLKFEKVRDEKEHAIYKFNFAGLLGYRCYGWLSIPLNQPRPMPGVLVLPPAGNRGQAVPFFPDAVGMAININGQDVDAAAVTYDNYTWPAAYLVTGILDKEHYSLRFGYAALVRAAELLAAREEVDEKDIRVQGSSQGGGLTLIAAGLFDGFTQATAIKPGLCRLDWNLDYLNPSFFPIACNAWTHPAISETLRYFLPSHFARTIRCPIRVSLGLYDDVTPAVGVFCAFNVIPGDQKTLIVDPAGAH